MIPKFRLFDKDTKEWQSIRSIGLEEDGSILYIHCWDKYEVDIDPPYFMDNLGIDFELMQSTGLHDKNGKEIFEGDIVKFNDCLYAYTGGFMEDKMRIGVVTKKYACFMVTNSEYESDLFITLENDEELEIIGNIHEHSGLLKEDGE